MYRPARGISPDAAGGLPYTLHSRISGGTGLPFDRRHRPPFDRRRRTPFGTRGASSGMLCARMLCARMLRSGMLRPGTVLISKKFDRVGGDCRSEVDPKEGDTLKPFRVPDEPLIGLR